MYENRQFSGNHHETPEFDVPWGVIRVGAVVALSLFYASYMPAAFVAPMMRSLMLLAALVSAVMAVVRRHGVLDPRMNLWDEAAVFLFLSILSGLFVDPGAVMETLNTMGVNSG